MAYSATAYLYIYYRTEEEGQSRVDTLFEKLKGYGEKCILELEDDKTFSVDDQNQLIIKNNEFQEIWNVFNVGLGMYKTIDFQLINLETNDTLCQEPQKKFILSLLDAKLIDIAKILIPRSQKKNWLFLKKYDTYYYGYVHALIMHLMQLKYFYTNKKIEKYNEGLNDLLHDYWNKFKFDEVVVEFDARNKNKFLNNNNSEFLRDLQKIAM